MARAPFSELPLELKEMIVAMASDQEDAYKGRVTSLADRAGHINCLNSLSLVNRELSELTARHRFNVLSAGRAELSGEYSLDAGLEEGTFFETTIFPRHRHHMKELVFKDTDYFDVSNNAMAFIDRLPALRALEFNENSVLRMFDGYRFLMRFRPDGSIASDERRLVYVALKIETLILREFEPLWAIEFARAFTNLRSLSLVELRDGDNMEETQALARGIATLRQLRSLSIELDRDAWANQWSPEAVAPLLLDPPPLKSLHLLWFPLQSIPLLTSIFVSSLETLCIHLRNQDNISPEELEELSDLSSLSPVQLPLLTSLTITSKYSSDLDDISRLLLSSSTLTELVCNLDDISLDPTDEASAPLLRLLDSQPSLLRVQLRRPPKPTPTQDLLSLSFVAAYTTLVHSRNLDPSVLLDPSVARFYTADAVECTANEAEVLEVALRRTLAFATEELERAVAEGKVGSVAGWVKALRPVEERRLAWND